LVTLLCQVVAVAVVDTVVVAVAQVGIKLLTD
jgi:hypothetical protein